MLTHYGVVANVIQTSTYENFTRKNRTEAVTGAISFSHSYGLIIGHLVAWRGDSYIVFPRFDLQLTLQAVPTYQVNRLYLVCYSHYIGIKTAKLIFHVL